MCVDMRGGSSVHDTWIKMLFVQLTIDIQTLRSLNQYHSRANAGLSVLADSKELDGWPSLVCTALALI